MGKIDLDYRIDPDETQDIPLRAGDLEEDFILQPVSALMHTHVGTVSGDDTIWDAAQIMTQGHFGCVLYLQDGRLTGILSERDVMTRIVSPGLSPKKERVEDHMTLNPETLQPQDEVAFALHIMATGGFRHVPIVDENGALQGIVSVRDLQKKVLEHFEKDILTLPPLPVRRWPRNRFGG